MGKVLPAIDDRTSQFILEQKMFFVATAPLAATGHVNVSPKGLGNLAILGPTAVAYLDYPGSGVETIAHVRENGRIVLMFCAFEGPPKIVRLHGTGTVVEPGDPAYPALIASFEPALAPRSIVCVDVQRISTSCGYTVPLFEYRGQREQLVKWGANKGAAGLEDYMREKNARSLDGLPGLRWVAVHGE